MMSIYSTVSRRATRRAFTLVELMISVALVVVLMLAVTQIFSIASKTMGGSQALAASVRDSQSAQTVFARDMSAVAPDGACFIIHNTRMAMWRNAADEASRVTTNPPNPLEDDIDDDRSTAELTYSVFDLNHRNHRQDYLMFFARDLFPRQTGTDQDPGNNPPLIAQMSSREAAVFYHHLALPTNSGAYTFTDGTVRDTFPGFGSSAIAGNDNNYFANQWTLGRVAMLLVTPSNPGELIYDRSLPLPGQTAPQPSKGSIADQDYYQGPTSFNAYSSIQTFQRSRAPRWNNTGDTFATARFDVVGTSITEFRSRLKDDITNNVGGARNGPGYWWTTMMCNDRFRAMPFFPQPLTSAGLAKTAPIFIPACTQFCVEFAGDFLVQDWDPVTTGNDPADSDRDRQTDDRHPDPTSNSYYGRVIGPGQDGRIDRIYIPAPSPLIPGYVGPIRWYGLPRDSNGDGRIVANEGDVVPVRDIARARQTFEKVGPLQAWPSPTSTSDTQPNPLPSSNYGNVLPGGNVGGAVLATAPEYFCAWGPTDTNRPKMIRIIIGIDKPEAEGKLPDGQMFEYVYNVGH